jgi:hypothetical protein
MSREDGSIGWQQLREFSDVDLAKSFVLSWHVEVDTLVIDIDLCLQPGHPFYEEPRPAEKRCIRPAWIEFPACDAIHTGDDNRAEVVEVAGVLEHGAIADLAVLDDGQYAISGEFGTVFINAERPILRLKQP